jgi:hypothetical protein
MDETRTSLACLPYLPLGGAHQISDWLILPVGQYSGEWASGAYKARVEQLLRRFIWPNGTAITDIPIVVSANDGANGVIPNHPEGRALQLAINFAAIDEFMTSTGDKQGRMLTTDNAELHIWPLGEDGYIAYPTGMMVRTTWGGWNLDDSEDAWRVPAPMELFMPLIKVSFYDRLANSIYETVLRGDGDVSNVRERRLAVALGWLGKAWKNTPSISAEDRIIFLKTGFESLLDTSSTPIAAKQLRKLFEDAAAHAQEDLRGLLWSTAEIENRPHPFSGAKYQQIRVTDLEHWFLSFGSARNDVIHEGAAGNLEYSEAGSAYNGTLVMTAERVLRESIKMELELLGYGGLWKTGLERVLHEALSQIDESSD